MDHSKFLFSNVNTVNFNSSTFVLQRLWNICFIYKLVCRHSSACLHVEWFLCFPTVFCSRGGWVGFVFYNAMFEICPPSQNPLFIHTIKCDGLFFPVCRYDFHPLLHPSERRMAVQLHFSSEKRCRIFPLSVVHCVCGHSQHAQFLYYVFYLYIWQ